MFNANVCVDLHTSKGDVMRCLLFVSVRGNDGAASIGRYIDIPFLPIPGLKITGAVSPDGRLHEVIVDDVWYDVDTGEIEVDLKEESRDDSTLSEMLADWGDEWTRLQF